MIKGADVLMYEVKGSSKDAVALKLAGRAPARVGRVFSGLRLPLLSRGRSGADRFPARRPRRVRASRSGPGVRPRLLLLACNGQGLDYLRFRLDRGRSPGGVFGSPAPNRADRAAKVPGTPGRPVAAVFTLPGPSGTAVGRRRPPRIRRQRPPRSLTQSSPKDRRDRQSTPNLCEREPSRKSGAQAPNEFTFSMICLIAGAYSRPCSRSTVAMNGSGDE